MIPPFSVPDSRYIELQSSANRLRIASLFSRLSPEFQPILLKGYSIGRFYPSDRPRHYTDIDITVRSRDFDLISERIRSLDLRIPVDLHCEFRTLDLASWDELFDRSYCVDLDGTLIRVLSDEDNLRVTAVHWLTDGGIDKERLWDIYYLVDNRSESFDWQRCLDLNGPVRKTWVVAAIATARDHLGLDVSGLPEDIQRFRLPAWYKTTLHKEWSLGVYSRRLLSTIIMQPDLLFEQLRRRFPPNKIAATIDSEYPIDHTSRIPAQVKSLAGKVAPFARGLGRRLTLAWKRGQN